MYIYIYQCIISEPGFWPHGPKSGSARLLFRLAEAMNGHLQRLSFNEPVSRWDVGGSRRSRRIPWVNTRSIQQLVSLNKHFWKCQESLGYGLRMSSPSYLSCPLISAQRRERMVPCDKKNSSVWVVCRISQVFKTTPKTNKLRNEWLTLPKRYPWLGSASIAYHFFSPEKLLIWGHRLTFTIRCRRVVIPVPGHALALMCRRSPGPLTLQLPPVVVGYRRQWDEKSTHF